jgi:hypothetical protein
VQRDTQGARRKIIKIYFEITETGTGLYSLFLKGRRRRRRRRRSYRFFLRLVDSSETSFFTVLLVKEAFCC